VANWLHKKMNWNGEEIQEMATISEKTNRIFQDMVAFIGTF
jgi:hypothetical protein